MTTPPGDNPSELAAMPHLSDLQATDALLDRLGARTPVPDDLADPIVAELAALAEFADASPIPPPGIERLLEVLDGRPLFMFDRGNAEVTEADLPIDLGEVRPVAQMIDLTGAARRGSATASSAGYAAPVSASGSSGQPGSDCSDLQDDDQLAARTATDESAPAAAAAGGARILRLVRRPVTKTGWQGAVQQLALPAASVVALLALGGGVSAVVTGDPMSPVYGVSKVASAFGGNNEKTRITKVTRELSAANYAASHNNPGAAKEFIKSARSHLAGVANNETSKALQVEINRLESALPVTGPSDPAGTAGPTPVVSATLAPTAAPTSSASVPAETTTAASPSTTTPATTTPATSSSSADASATAAPPAPTTTP